MPKKTQALPAKKEVTYLVLHPIGPVDYCETCQTLAVVCLDSTHPKTTLPQRQDTFVSDIILLERCEICEVRGCDPSLHSTQDQELKAFCRKTIHTSARKPSLDDYDSQGQSEFDADFDATWNNLGKDNSEIAYGGTEPLLYEPDDWAKRPSMVDEIAGVDDSPEDDYEEED